MAISTTVYHCLRYYSSNIISSGCICDSLEKGNLLRILTLSIVYFRLKLGTDYFLYTFISYNIKVL